MESKNLPNDYSAGIICDNYATVPAPCFDTRDDTISASGFRSGYKTWALNWTPTKLEFIYEGQVKHTLTTANRIVHVPERLILSGSASASLQSNLSVNSENDSGKIDWIRIHKDNEMDWGNGYFKIINKDTVAVLEAPSSGDVFTAPFQNGDDYQLWQIDRDTSCPSDIYAIKSKATSHYLNPLNVDINPGVNNRKVVMSAATIGCKWRINFSENSDGKDYYEISTYDFTATQNLLLFAPTPTTATYGDSTASNRGKWQIVWVQN